MPLTEIEIDETPHNMDGLLLHGRDGSERVEAFISKRVMVRWVEPYRKRRSLFARNTMPSANSIWWRLSELPLPSTSVERHSTDSIRLWIFCCPTSRKAKRRSI
jgi:hypothetical protein